MCESELLVRNWLNALIPKITRALKKDFDKVQYEITVPGDSFYLSTTYCVSIREKGKDENEKDETINVVVKRPPQAELIREIIKSDSQFHNEILFYRTYAEQSEDFPRCIYLQETPLSDTVIVLENIKERGYELCSWKYDAPIEYTLAAMREIGRFHGKGYVMKERQREKFFSIVENIQETRYEKMSDNMLVGFVNLTASRSIEYLRNRGYDEGFCKKMETFLEDAFQNVMMESVKPSEPLSTLCHGDFTLNNTLFQKNNDNIKAMLIDFALIRYGTPAIDLSTYLSLHCPSELKKEKFQSVLKVYHDSLKEYLIENDAWDSEKFSYESLYNDYKQRGLFGYIIASFYLPTLLGKDMLPLDVVIKMDPREAALLCRKAGGDELSKMLVDMLFDLREIGCLENIV